MIRSPWRLVALLIPAIPAVLLIGLWLFLSTPSGKSWLAQEATTLVNRQIQGRVTARSISPGFDRIEVEGVEVFDPEGRKVLEAERIDLRAIPTLGLLRGEVDVDSLTLESPALWWVTPAGGGEAGLVRAFAPKVPSTEESAGGHFRVQLEKLRIDGGSLWLQEQEADDVTTLAAIEGLSLEARGMADERRMTTSGSLAARATFPVDRQVHVSWDLGFIGGYNELSLVSLEVNTGESSASLAGIANIERQFASLTLRNASIAPSEIALVAPDWQLAAALAVEGSGSFEDGKLEAKVRVQQADGALTADIGLQPLGGSWAMKLNGHSLDPVLLDRRAPKGSLDFQFEGGGSSLSEGAGTLTVEKFEVGGEVAGPLRARAELNTRRLEVRELDLRLPGGRLQARGSQDLDAAQRSDLHFDLDLRDLKRLGRWSGRVLGDPSLIPPLEGALLAQGKLSGPATEKEISAKLSSRSFRYGEVAAKGVTGSLSVDGFPRTPTGKVDVTTESLLLGTSRFEQLRADLELRRGRLRGALEGRGAVGRIHTEIDAATNRDLSELRLEHLLVSWPRASWRLRTPATVTLGAQNEVKGLTLASDDGATVDASGSQGPGSAFRLDLQARRFDLGTLPAELVPAELGLEGRLDVDANLSGTTSRPRGKVDLALRGAGLSGEHLLDSTVELVFQGRTLDTVIAAKSSKGSVDATASLPWPFSERRPLQVQATVSRLNLAEISRLLALPQPVSGWVDGEVKVGGTASSPLGSLLVRGEGLGGGGTPASDATGRVEIEAGAESVTVSASLQQGEARVDADVSIAARAAVFLADPSAWKRVGVRGTTSVEGVDLGTWLPEAWTADPLNGVRGKAGLKVDWKGTVLSPVGTLQLVVRDGFSGGVGPLDFDLGLDLAENDLRMQIASHLLGRRFVEGEARLGASLQRILDGGWERAPVQGEFVANELELSAIAWAVGHRDPVGGVVDLTLRVDGSPDAPRIAVHGRAGQIEIGSLPFGDLNLGATWSDGLLVAEVGAFDPSGGEARLGARWKANLGVSTLSETLQTLSSAPLDVSLHARRFDLEFLEGLSRDVRQSGGKLSGELAVTGTLPLPTLDGRLLLEEGRFSYTGHGDLRDISALLEFSPNEWWLRHLEAHEAGVFRVSGAARRSSPLTSFEVSLNLDAKRFAIMASDLNRAWLDARAELTGHLDEAGFQGALDIKRATVTLPDTPNKNIQSLEPHPDFVFVNAEGNRRLPQRQEKKERSEGGMELTLDIGSSQPIQLTGTDLSMEAQVDLQAAMVGGSLALAGDIVVPRGFVRVMNRRFDLSRGRVSFLGPGSDPGDPRLDVQALYESPYATVTVTVGGTASKPTIHLRSNPAMSEAEIAMLLATGRAQLKAGSGGVSEASGAASALGTVLSSQLKKGVAARLPVDVISFEAGEEGLEGSRLEAGTYVGDKIYFGYARRFESQTTQTQTPRNENEVRFEYQLAPRWSLEVTYGDAYVGGADIFWTRDF